MSRLAPSTGATDLILTSATTGATVSESLHCGGLQATSAGLPR